MLKKAARYEPGGFIPDLEDSVPIREKDAARKTVAAAVSGLAATGLPVIPRVNSLPTDLTEEDIATVVGPQTIAISVGKIGGVNDIRTLDTMLTAHERAVGIEVESVGILAWVETAAGLVNSAAICRASQRVKWVAFGAEDFSADMGFARTVDSTTDTDEGPYGEPGLLHARSTVAIAARAANIQALDTPFVKFRDEEGLRNDCLLARRLGFTGKMAIHPAQVPIIEEMFKPTDQEIERARQVLKTAKDAESEGRGAVSLDGEMIDAPVIARAQNVLRQADLES